MKLRRRRRVKAFPQKRSQLGGCGLLPAAWGVGPCPAQCIWQGSGFAADQTNAMLAVGGTSCISLVSVAAADENSLTPLHRLLPAETASLGFGGSPVGGGDKNSRVIFFTFLCGGGITTLGPLWLCRKNPARGLFSRKNGFLRVGALRRRTRCSLLHTALFRRSCMGVVSLPSGCCGCVGTTRCGVYFGRKTAFSEWVLCADGHAVPSCTQCFFGTSVWGVVSLPSACASCR